MISVKRPMKIPALTALASVALEQLVVGVIGDHGGPHQTERQNSSQCTENSPLGQSRDAKVPSRRT